MKIKLFNKKIKIMPVPVFMFIMAAAGCLTGMPAYARAERAAKLMEILAGIVNIIATIIQAAGVLLVVYASGQLILSMKNEDADSKTRASTQLAVAVILICLPAIVKSLNLSSYF